VARLIKDNSLIKGKSKGMLRRESMAPLALATQPPQAAGEVGGGAVSLFICMKDVAVS
jgi:hypothetical protein